MFSGLTSRLYLNFSQLLLLWEGQLLLVCSALLAACCWPGADGLVAGGFDGCWLDGWQLLGGQRSGW